jgi:hypothetical protein
VRRFFQAFPPISPVSGVLPEEHKGVFSGGIFAEGGILPLLSLFTYTRKYLSVKKTDKKRVPAMQPPNKCRNMSPLRTE